jgi:hypothetical protein
MEAQSSLQETRLATGNAAIRVGGLAMSTGRP